MRLHTWVFVAAIGIAPAVAAAQSGSGGTAGTTGTTGTTGSTGTTATGGTTGGGQTGTTTGTTGGGQTGTTTGTTGGGQSGTTTSGSGQMSGMSGMSSGTSHWIASGFVGSDFGNQATGSSVDFGGSVGYLWNNWVGGEFLAGFAPNFQLQSTATNAFLLSGNNPAINSYMANAIGAISLGPDANWQPFVSGGFGAIQLRSGLNNINTSIGTTVTNSFNSNESRAAGNIGAGVMGFMGGWGIRADVRYFRAFSQSDNGSSTSTTNGSTSNLGIVPGLDFWRANIGVAFRW